MAQISFLGGLFLLISNPCSIIGTRCPGVTLYNSIWALVGSYPLLTVPLTVWFLAAYYRDLPSDIEDAARADGATQAQSFFYILLPLAAPALVTTGLLAFITAWNEFLFPVTFTLDETSRTATIQVSMYGFVGYGTILSLACSIILMAPVLVLVLAFGPQITSGLAGLTGAAPAVGWWQRFDQRGRLPRFALDAPARTLLAVLLLGALLFGRYGWSVIQFPFSADYGEGPLLAQTIQMASGQNIYHASLAAPPYTVANYPPLYMLVLTPFVRLFGPAFWYGRLVSWLSMIAAAVLIGAILHALTRDWVAALLGGLLLLAVPYVAYWAPLYRVDALALALSLSGLYVAVRWPERWWGVHLAALLLTAAVFSRQSAGLAAPLAAFGWLLARQPRRRALLLVGVMAGVGAGLLALINLATGGGFWFNIITANINEFQLDRLREFLFELWIRMPFAVAGTLLFVLAGWRLRAWPVLAPYCVGAALVGLTIGKVGSNVNYLLEFSAAMCLALGAALAGLRPFLLGRQVLMAALAVQFTLLVPGSNYQMLTQLRLAQRYDFASLQRLVNSTSRPVLADEDMGLLVLDGRPLVIQPFEATQLARAGVWDQRPFLQAIDRQDFAAILIFRVPGIDLEKERWTPEMLQQIERRYQPAERIGNTIVYRPKHL
jgi:ABC-type molybdate transport system permease subunit